MWPRRDQISFCTPVGLGSMILLFAVFLWTRGHRDVGLGMGSIGMAVLLGGWALVAQWRSERATFLEADRDLFNLRKTLRHGGDSAQSSLSEWVTWDSKIICERADLTHHAASPADRRHFLSALDQLVRFVADHSESFGGVRYKDLDHLLTACTAIDGWDEVDGSEGATIIETFSLHLGDPGEDEDFAAYVRRRRDTLKEIKHADLKAYEGACERSQFLRVHTATCSGDPVQQALAR